MIAQTPVLITGGAGFLGINLCRYLLARGYNVRSLDVAPFDYPEQNAAGAGSSGCADTAVAASQSAGQQATDRYECHRWAVNETGFDPTQPLGGVAPEQSTDKRASYSRAITACLEGRGYSVK